MPIDLTVFRGWSTDKRALRHFTQGEVHESVQHMVPRAGFNALVLFAGVGLFAFDAEALGP
jgi:hypothetical protein